MPGVGRRGTQAQANRHGRVQPEPTRLDGRSDSGLFNQTEVYDLSAPIARALILSRNTKYKSNARAPRVARKNLTLSTNATPPCGTRATNTASACGISATQPTRVSLTIACAITVD